MYLTAFVSIQDNVFCFCYESGPCILLVHVSLRETCSKTKRPQSLTIAQLSNLQNPRRNPSCPFIFRVPAAAPLSLEQSGDPGNLGEAIRSSPINHLIGSPDQVRRERRRREKGEKRMKEREAGGLIIPDRGRRRRRRKRAVGGEQLKQEREEGVVGEATKGRPKQQKYERKKKKQSKVS